MARTRTNPAHKASFSIGVQGICSCGWRTSMWMNKGAKSNASQEWRAHREHCELVERLQSEERAARTLSDVADDKSWKW